MSDGVIKFAEHEGVFVIKMEGDVRLTLCLSFDDFIDKMFKQKNFCSVAFDLTEAIAIDSTTLGLMAKIAIEGQDLLGGPPLVLINNTGVRRTLETMGFQDIFRMVDKITLDTGEFQSLSQQCGDASVVQKKVLEAHKTLMSMNDHNANTFQELVDSLEGDS